MQNVSKQIKLKDIAYSLGDSFKQEENNLALLIFGSVARKRIDRNSDLDLLLITERGTSSYEPKNMEELIIDDVIVQVSKITVTQLEKDLKTAMDYRINQLKEGLIIFDKKGLLKSVKENLRKMVLPNKVLESQVSELQGDREFLLQKFKENSKSFPFFANRTALWALRIYLTLKGDYFQGPKTLENHMKRHPKIKALFLDSFGSQSINLNVKTELSKFIAKNDKHVYLKMVRDMLIDAEELQVKGRSIVAEASIVEGVTYLGLYLQEKRRYSGWETLIDRDKFFNELARKVFPRTNNAFILRNNLKLNELVVQEVRSYQKNLNGKSP